MFPEEDGADVIAEPEVELDVTDMAAVEAESMKDAAEEPEVEENEAESPPAVEEDDEEKTNPFQERIDKLTTRWRDTERSLTALEQENDDLRRKVSEMPLPVDEVKTLKDFDYDESKYQSYVFETAEKRAEAAAERVIGRTGAQDRQTESQDKFKIAEKEFAGSVEDYNDTVYNPSLRISGSMAESIQSSDIGPELGYYLGKHPEEAADIFELPPAVAGRKLGILEASLKAEKAKITPKKVSDAPPPPSKKVSGPEPGKKVSTTDPGSDKMSDKEWFAAEEKRTAKFRG